MRLHCTTQPVVILGMSRSGTTLLARLLSRLGLFLGHRMAEDLEAVYFHSLNATMIKRIHGYWDNPGPVRYFLQDDGAVKMTVQHLEVDLTSYRVASFLGWVNFFKYRSLLNYDRPWGWKDPQTILTLPLWLALFPQAKIVYIVRNGVDVAHSLRAMEQRVIAKRQKKNSRRLKRMTLRNQLERAGFKGSARSLCLAGGFSLWEEYVAQAEECLVAVDNDRCVIKFEDLLAEPKTQLLRLQQFCQLDASEEAVDDAVKTIRADRSHAFASDPALKDFYRQVHRRPWMTHYGYSDFR